MGSVELHDTFITYRVPDLVYTPNMGIIDDKTKKNYGITHSGRVDEIGFGDPEAGRTVIEFIEYVRKTGDHVDEANIITLRVGNSDIQDFYVKLGERLAQ